MAKAQVQPGDWFVTNPGGDLFRGIEIAESIANRRLTHWGHAGVASRWVNGVLMIVQAEPGGAVEVPWGWGQHVYKWSTGILPNSSLLAEAALRYTRPGPWGDTGVPYSYLDYAALTLHHLHIPAPHLRAYIKSTHHMICSQLVDQAAQDAGVQLFDDRRWPGDVMPSDLGWLLDNPVSMLKKRL